MAWRLPWPWHGHRWCAGVRGAHSTQHTHTIAVAQRTLGCRGSHSYEATTFGFGLSDSCATCALCIVVCVWAQCVGVRVNVS